MVKKAKVKRRSLKGVGVLWKPSGGGKVERTTSMMRKGRFTRYERKKK